MGIFQRAQRRSRGATGVEYGLILGLLALAILSAVTLTGQEIGALFDRAASALGGEVGGDTGTGGAPGGGAPAGGLVLAPVGGQGVTVVPGAGGSTASYTVTNTGTAPAPAAISVAAPFSLVSTTCPAQLAAQASCSVSVTATASENGALSGALQVGSATIALSGSASGFDAAVALSWPSGAVAEIADGSTVGPEIPLQVVNSGFGRSGAVSVVLTAGASHFAIVDDGCASADLAPGESCTVTVARTAAGTEPVQTGTISVSFAGGASGSTAVSGAATGYVLACSNTMAAGTLCAAGGGLAVHVMNDINLDTCPIGQSWTGSGCSGTAAQYSFSNGTTATFRSTDQTGDPKGMQALLIARRGEQAGPYAAAEACAARGSGWFLPTTAHAAILGQNRDAGALAGTLTVDIWTSTSVSSSPFVIQAGGGTANRPRDTGRAAVRCMHDNS